MSDANKTQVLSPDPNRTQLGTAPVYDPNRTMLGSAPSLNATQIIKPVQCPVCKTFNPAGVMFCIDCGLIFDRALPGDAFGAPAIQLPMLLEAGGKEQPIRPGMNIVGREGDIALPDGRVSRRHAQISNEGGRISIQDLGSTNGTKVNGSALAAGQQQELVGGDKISFGGLEVLLSLPGAISPNATQAFASNKTSAMAAPPQKERAAAHLVGEGQEYPLKQGRNTFGRREGNDVRITDAYVSGQHGQIEILDEGIFLTDIGSSNGTVVNEAKLSPNMRTVITPEDVIRLGSLEFQVRLDPSQLSK
jgi:pSer/pThr/pTyr-binding forkhead associated (FHA) protein